MIISFRSSAKELLSGKQTVTRRNWSQKYHNWWLKLYDEGDLIHPAYDCGPWRKIGNIKLTERPYREALGNMPESDLIAGGGIVDTKEAFYDLMKLHKEAVVSVVRFQWLGSNGYD